MGLEDAFSLLLQGLGLIGNAITFFIKWIFSIFGFEIPDWIISVATIIVLLISVLAIGSKLGKIVLTVLVFLIVSCSAGLLAGLLHIG